MHFSALLVAAACASTASAHVALWDKGMFGLNYPYKSDDPQNHNYNNNEPVIPLKQVDGRTTAQWFGHGLLDYPPKAGDFMVLPSGGTYNGQVSCNRGQTTLGNPADTTPKYKYACKPDGGQYTGVGALHVMNTYDGPVDNKWFGGSSLAIAYTSDVSKLKPNDLTVISVNQNSVWEREISYSIPAGMPPCPPGGCLCSWNWIHQGGHGEGYPYEIYNTVYRCTVTGATNSAKVVQKGAVPNKCDGNPSKCVKGPKTPMYLWQADGNNLPDLDTPPNYNDNWGFADGAQNDIFTPAATPAGSSDPAPTATALPTGWTALGCMQDSTSARALPGVSTSSGNNTIQDCVASCNSKGYNFAGVEYGQECWCSNTATLKAANENECNVVCPGDIWSKCGGGSRINVFRSARAPTTGQPVPLPASSLPAGWSDLGCVVDDQNNRALNGGSSQSSSNTVQSCIAQCSSKGFAYAGVEYGQECWCGSSARLTAASSGCNVACAGDPAHVCGGASRLNVYSSKPAASSAAASSAKASSTSLKASSTVASSTSAKASSSSSKAATSASTKPTSSSAKPSVATSSSKAVLTSTSKAATPTSSSKPAATSTSKAASTTSRAASTSSSKATSATTSKATPTTSSSAPAATLPGGWKSLGCYTDSSNARVLTGFYVAKTDMTQASCIDICARRNFAYAGVENGSQCFCGNATASLKAASGCDKPCLGAKDTMCGGFNRIGLMQNTAAATAARRARRHRIGVRGAQ